jgi:hypothetical protein
MNKHVVLKISELVSLSLVKEIKLQVVEFGLL